MLEFLAHLGDRADKPLSCLTPRHVESFVTERMAAGLSSSTVTLDAKVLRTALNPTGHTTEAVHRGYTYHELETLRGAVAKLHSLA